MEPQPLHPIERMNKEELLAEYNLAEWNVEAAILYMKDVLDRLQVLSEYLPPAPA